MKEKGYKTELCKYYNSTRGCDKGNKCSFAHGKEEKRRKKCKNYERCWNEHCNFEHPENWNPKKK